ncbi:hypothetical protein ACFXPZ_00245, partial [Streptomyces sp. NPDC059101]
MPDALVEPSIRASPAPSCRSTADIWHSDLTTTHKHLEADPTRLPGAPAQQVAALSRGHHMPQPLTLADDLRNAIRIFPDFPQPGIQFKDFTPVFAQPRLVRRIAEHIGAAFDGEFDRVLA